VPWPETTLAREIDGVVFHVVHVPNAANGWVKIETLEAIRAGLAATTGARVLCGDLNTPRREHEDGSVLTFAHDSAGRLRPERGERWDAAERALVHTLRAEHGWTDAFRALHGFGTRDASWTFQHDRGGWRLDHVLVFGLEPVACAYAHEWRRAGLSDHSALVADFRPPAPPRA
jgi:exonuclease III